IGKTRLALAVADAHTAVFADGVAFVALAAVGTPNQIVSAIGDALNLDFASQHDPTARLLGYLRARRMLLILDIFDLRLGGADLFAASLAQAPQLTILMTSRERLNLRAEWVFDVDGLAYPPEEPYASGAPHPLLEPTRYGAVQLFVQRATQVQ